MNQNEQVLRAMSIEATFNQIKKERDELKATLAFVTEELKSERKLILEIVNKQMLVYNELFPLLSWAGWEHCINLFRLEIHRRREQAEHFKAEANGLGAQLFGERHGFIKTAEKNSTEASILAMQVHLMRKQMQNLVNAAYKLIGHIHSDITAQIVPQEVNEMYSAIYLASDVLNPYETKTEKEIKNGN